MTDYQTETIDELTEHPSGAEMRAGDRAAIARGNSPTRANKATFPTDYSIADRAFSNPPSDLTEPEKAAVRTAIGAATPGEAAGGIPDKATNADIDAETDDAKYVTVVKVYRAIGRKVKAATSTVAGIVRGAATADRTASSGSAHLAWSVTSLKAFVENIVPSWARQPSAPSGGGTSLPDIPEDNFEYVLTGRDRIGSGGNLEPLRFWRRPYYVPSGPATQSGIGHVLTVIGQGDRDYAWRSLNTAIAAYLAANPIAQTEQRVLVNVPASNATVDKIIEEDGQLYTTVDRVTHQATAKQAAYQNIRFDLGYFSDESALDATFYRPGRYYYNFALYTPRVVAYISGNSGPKHWVDANAEDLVTEITGDVGHFISDEEATPYVNAVGNVYYNERLRTYRRVTTFTAGSGPVVRKERLRQANADDLARLDDEIALRGTRMQASPQVVNKDDVADEYTFTLWTVPGYYSTATMARIKFLTDAAEGTILRPYDPQAPVHRFTIELDDDQKRMAQQASPGNTEFATIDLLDSEGAVLPRWDIPGVVQGQAFVVMTVIPGPRIGKRQMSDAINDLERRASDLRVVAPPGWETAIGTGVGISLTTAVVADVTALSYNPTVTIPADAEAGDDYFIYMAVPTGSNLSDWRVDLAGFAQYPGFNFGEVGVDGSNTVYSYLFTVGDDSGGFASGTAPGARLTLQHHGTTPHTAFSGELEGRALQQVSGTAPLFSPSKSNLYAAVKQIFHPATNAGVTADDANNELDVAAGGGGSGLNQAQVDARVLALRSLVTTPSTPVAGDRFFFTDENQAGDPLRYTDVYTLRNQIVDDDSVLDAAKSSRTSADRGKFLGVDASNENALALLDAPTSGGGGSASLTQVQQIGLLKFSAESPTFQFVQNSELSGKTFNVLVDNPQLLTGDIWYERRLGANLVPGGRTKWTNTTFSIGFPVPSNTGAQELLANALTGDGLTLELRFYDASTGGNVVDLIRETVGGAHALEPAPVSTLDLYNAVNPKLPNRIYYWPNHQKDGKDVPAGIAVGGNIIARNQRLTQEQVELLIRRSPTAIYTIPDATTLTWDLDSGYIASVTLGGAPRNFQPLVNAQVGDRLILRVVQDATGGRVITWHSQLRVHRWSRNAQFSSQRRDLPATDCDCREQGSCRASATCHGRGNGSNRLYGESGGGSSTGNSERSTCRKRAEP